MGKHHPTDLKAITMRQVLSLILLGVLVGLACWPLNLIDHWQDLLLHHMPAYSGMGWTSIAKVLALAPLVVMPLLLCLQNGAFARGKGSGIPQTVACIEDPEQGPKLLGGAPTLLRLGLWSAASLALFPLGREGPVVQVGAAVAQALRSRWPRLFGSLQPNEVLAVAAGAGLAGGFNTPLMGVVFIAEELISRFNSSLIWPALLVCGAAAGISQIGGQPMFALGLITNQTGEIVQYLWAVPIGILGGLVGGIFGRLLLLVTAWVSPIAKRQPVLIGLALGGVLSVLAWFSEGASGGDGEALMSTWIQNENAWPGKGIPILVVRLIGPVVALGASVPGGLIDPAFALGAVFGHGFMHLVGGSAELGVALGMAATLAGISQLPVMTIAFAIRLAGDQQLGAGLLIASVVGAMAGRLLLDRPVYHALADLQRAPRR
jgi:H+/Cl- antiporter ClcA